MFSIKLAKFLSKGKTTVSLKINFLKFRLRAIIARGEEKRGAPGPQPPASNMKILVSKGLDKILVSQGLAIILVGKGLANKFW